MTSTSAPARRSRARRGEGDRLFDEILDAAEDLLIATGDEEAVSIRAIADAAGVTPPSIYLHFADKAELILAVCERQFRELDRVIQAAAAGVADPVEALRRGGRAYVQFGLDHPEQYRVLFMRRSSQMPEGFDESRVRTSSAFDHLVDTVQACIAVGAFPDDSDPFAVAVELWAIVHGITSLLISRPEFPWPDADALADHVMATACAGLQATPPLRRRRRRR